MSLLKRSIAYRLAAMLVMVTSLTLAGGGSLAFWFQYQQSHRNLRQDVVLDADQFSEALSLPLWNFQTKVIDRILDSLMEDRALSGIIVRQPDVTSAGGAGQFVRTRDAQWHSIVGMPSLAGGGVTEERNIVYEGKIIGSIQMIGTTRWIDAQLWSMFASLLVLILLLETVLVAFLYLLLRRDIIAPVLAIGKFAERVIVTGGKPAEAPRGRFHGELDGLRSSIEAMVSLLQDRYVKLEANEARFRTLIEEGPAALCVVRDQKMIYGNWKFMTLFGFQSEEDFAGRSIGQLIAPEVRVEVLERSRQRQTGGTAPSEYETIGRRKNGSPFPARVAVAMIDLADGPAQLAFLTDITEQIKAQETQYLLASILEQTPDAVLTTDLGGVVIQWNKAAEKIFGYSAEEAIGKFGFLVEPGGRPGETVERRKAFSEGKDIDQYETLRKRKDGKSIHLSVSASVLKDRSGQPVGYAAIYRDISGQAKAQETQRLLAYILEQTADAVAMADLEGKIILWNQGAERLFGYKADEILGKPGGLLDPPDQHGVVDRKRAILEKGDGSHQYEAARKRKDGTLVQVAVTSGPLKDPSGSIIGYSAIYRDITERKKAEETQKRLASILEQTTDAVSLIDLEGRFVDLNSGAEELYGYKREDLLGKFPPFMDPEDYKGLMEKIKKETEGRRKVYRYEAKRKKRGGGLMDVESAVTAIRNERGDVIGYSFIVRDITERKKAEEIQAQLADMLQQTPDPVTGTNLEGTILTWNHSAERVFGYKAEEIIGKNITQLTPDDRLDEMRGIREIVAGGEVVSNLETERLKKGGERVNVSLTLFPMRDSAGMIKGISAIYRDITEKKHAEDSLRRHEEQMRLMEKMNAIGRLAGGVAHDFNNLLSVIGGNAEFLASGLGKESSHREEVEDIRQAVHRGAELTKQLLIFGRKQVSQPQTVDLNQLASELQKMLKRLLYANIELTIKVGKDLRPILADPGQIQQVMMNLTINARDAMPKGGILVIETRNAGPQDMDPADLAQLGSGPHVCFTVTDTGEGMSPEVQKRIFEPFFTTKGIGKGTGLGLATVYGIVQQWKGLVKVRSSLGKGTTFTVLFPALESQQAPAGPSAAVSRTVPRGSETILLVEDEDGVRKMLVRTLKGLGYKVLEASDGLEAVKNFWGHPEPIHLLLTDTVMPKMNGKELADELRKVRTGMKVLFISGYPEEILSQQGVLGPDIFLIQKPFELEDLARKVRTILESK